MNEKTDLEKLLPHVRALEEAGCCVVVFTPEELRGAPVDYVADRLTEYGWDVIDDLAAYDPKEEEA